MNKRGQGISINVIVFAAIALLVLVVLSVVFLGRFGVFPPRQSEPIEIHCVFETGGDIHKIECTDIDPRHQIGGSGCPLDRYSVIDCANILLDISPSDEAWNVEPTEAGWILTHN